VAGAPANRVTGSDLLRNLASAYRRRRILAEALLTGGGALLGAGIARMTGGGIAAEAAAAFGVAVSLAAAAGVWNRRHPAGPLEVARHLDRTVPAVEESAELMLADAATLPLVDRLERARVDRAVAAAPRPGVPPDHAARRAVVAGLAAALGGAALLLGTASGGRAATSPTHPAAPTRGAMIGGVSVRVEPPAYTGAPAREESGWEIEAPEGSLITWRIGADADHAWLATSNGDTVALTPDGSARTARLRAGASLLYQIVAERSGMRSVSELHRLAVQADAPPTLAIAAPPPRTALAPGDQMRIAVEVRAGDDWGVGPARLVATLTSGEGEAVKFREAVVPLAVAGSRPDLPHGLTLRTTLDLAALGLKPGDELYFHAEAADRRTPAPNTARSETVFLSLADTGGHTSATIAGIAVSLAPEYFRSQRQIIMDTEKLLADRKRIMVEAFRSRSNDIGLDQSLLRGRYGQYVGDETETGEDAVTGHQHDTPENATLLAESVKAKLKAALAQMWEAELRLRTYRPAEALPYEYRALERLKDAQQSARVYVQRVGFEPPPLDPARTRLSGKLGGIISRTDRDSAGAELPLPATRAALVALSGTSPTGLLDARAATALDRAIGELAPRAAADSGVFATVRMLQALVEAARTGARCDGCAGRAVRGLLHALPAAGSLPEPRREPVVPLARRYFDLLRTGR
jgi:hypothetical protein